MSVKFAGTAISRHRADNLLEICFLSHSFNQNAAYIQFLRADLLVGVGHTLQ